MSTQPASPHPTDPDQTVRIWRAQAATLGGRDTLLAFRPSHDGSLELSHAHPSGLAQLLAGRPTRLSSLLREAHRLDDGARRVSAVASHGRRLHDERGLDVIGLAVGMAVWPGPVTAGGVQERLTAPVVLRSVTLRPVGADARDWEIAPHGRSRINPALTRALADQFGIALDHAELLALARRGGGLDAGPVLDRLREQTGAVPGFEVRGDLVISSFADLRALAVDPRIDRHPVVRALAGDAEARAARLAREPAGAALAGEDDPAGELLVADADAEQHRVIDAATAGSDLAVVAPPGTGVTQTLLNVLATGARAGRHLLLTTESRASWQALAARLGEVGLASLALDTGADEETLRRTLVAAIAGHERAVAPDLTAGDQRLVELRRELAGHGAALHGRRSPWNVSPYEAMVQLARLTGVRPAPATRVRLPRATLELGEAGRAEIVEDLAAAARLGAFKLSPEDTAWYGARLYDPARAEEARATAGTLAEEILPALAERMPAVAEEAGIVPTDRIAGWREQLTLLLAVRRTLDQFVPEVYERSVADLVAATATPEWRQGAGIRMGAFARMRLRREAAEYVRPGAEVGDLHAALVRVQEQRVVWLRHSVARGLPKLLPGLGGIEDLVRQAESAIELLDPVLETTPDGGDLEHMPRAELEARLRALAEDAQALETLPQRSVVLDRLSARGLDELVEDLTARHVGADAVADEFELAWWQSVLGEMMQAGAALGSFDVERLQAAADEFCQADAAHVAAGPARVRWSLAERWREAIADHPMQAELLREALRAGRIDLPDLLARAPQVVLAAVPVWVASPLNVPALVAGVPADAPAPFDTVLVADAGRTGVPEVLDAVAAGRSLVAVGDPAGLGPGIFSVAGDRAPAAGDEAVPTPSLLDVARATSPVVELRTSYRAGNAALSFAGERYYGGRPRTLPRPGGDPGLTFELVADGTGLPTGTDEAVESVDAEVARVVDLVGEEARRHPGDSLAVITPSRLHAQRIREALLGAASHHPEFAALLTPPAPDRRAEPFVVVTLDEAAAVTRDRVVFTLGFGRTPHGRVIHRFGPLSLPGGSRRMAVAATRARRHLTVVTCLEASDLDPERLRFGAVDLRAFLAATEEAASHGGRRPGLPPEAPAATERGDALLGDLSARLLRRGLYAVPDYGGEIDLAVVDLGGEPAPDGAVDSSAAPAAWVAVESDGLRGAAVTSLRERLRLRPDRLRRAGWRVVRVWSTALFADPEGRAREIARLCSADGPGPSGPPAGTAPGPAGPELPEDPTTRTEPVERNDRADAERAEPHPDVTPGLPITAYSREELEAVARWLCSDGHSRTIDAFTDELRHDLGQARKGPRVESALRTVAERVLPAAQRLRSPSARGATHQAGAVRRAARGDGPVLPDRADYDSDRSWGDGDDSNDARLLRDRPPHWG